MAARAAGHGRPSSYPHVVEFALTDEQAALRDLTREVVAREIEPFAATWDRERTFPRALFARLGELGLMGICVPEELGGAGADFVSYVIALEELSRGDAGVGVTVAVHTSAATLPLIAFGTHEQKERFVPALARGESLGAFALTEPGSGSDAGSLRTVADPVPEGWSLTGTKQWITTGADAGTILLFARTNRAVQGSRGVSAFILDGDQVEVTRVEEKLGLHSSSTVDLALSDVHVGRERLLHEEGKGFVVAMNTLDGGRIGIAAQAVGIAQAALEAATAHAVEREQFGSKIAEFQAIQFKLADMATEISAARLLTYRAAWLKHSGLPHAAEGAMAKLYASRTAVNVSQEAIQVLGGVGYTTASPVERYYRDAKITEIYEGTSEIQRIVIARDVLRRLGAAR
jgi:alkylation response protein AidB-like acyl-CoA dehydrogenase